MPPNLTDTQQRIVDVAEVLFAERGVAEASLREITTEAEVNLAAVNYHFGSKMGLVEAILRQRGGPLAERRSELLAAAVSSTETRPGVRGILHAFVAPVFELRSRAPHFPRLLARVQMEGLLPELGEVLHAMFYRSFVEFTEALSNALPDIPVEEIRWRLFFTVGTFHFVVCNEETIRAVHGDEAPHIDPESITDRIITFCEAGLCAPAPNFVPKGGPECV